MNIQSGFRGHATQAFLTLCLGLAASSNACIAPDTSYAQEIDRQRKYIEEHVEGVIYLSWRVKPEDIDDIDHFKITMTRKETGDKKEINLSAGPTSYTNRDGHYMYDTLFPGLVAGEDYYVDLQSCIFIEPPGRNHLIERCTPPKRIERTAETRSYLRGGSITEVPPD